MSKAGIQSNRGDGYQTLIAFHWALTVISDPDYEWLEVDSVAWPVDDVVVGKVDGTVICCQCKKNQSAFKAWSITDLADELEKVATLFRQNQATSARFYSRSNFGELSSLREFSTNYPDETSYKASMGKAHKETDTKLADLIAGHAPNISTFDFLQRTSFDVSDELDIMTARLRERLRALASNPVAAFSVLWTQLDQLGMRLSGDGNAVIAQHRLTKNDLKNLIVQAGSMLIPPMDVQEVLSAFRSTSAIGRLWRRDIGDRRLPIPLVRQILEAIEEKPRSILLTGLPGAGKTCIMLSLQEELEGIAKSRSDLLPLFIQSREFADFTTPQDRAAQGLSVHWVESVARLAEDAQIVVVIDSLDVLSIAREHSVLTYFLAQIDRLLLVPNVTVVTACRDFDRHYDRRIAQRSWEREFRCEPLDWETIIAPLLIELGIDASAVDNETRELICNPRELALYVELAQKNGNFKVVTSHALAQRYLDIIVQADSTLGDSAMHAIENLASQMLKIRGLALPRQRFTASQAILLALLSHNVIRKTEDGLLTFGHQSLLDVLVISAAARRGVTLNAFLHDLSPVPFVRPSIRSFVTQLSVGDRRDFLKQLRTVLTTAHPFHIRRLVAESMAEQIPQDDDWPLIRDLRRQNRDVFQVIYTQANRTEWHRFWLKHLVPALKNSRDADGLKAHVHRVAQWKHDDPIGVLAFWSEVLELDWMDSTDVAWQVEASLSDFHVMQPASSVARLLRTLLALPRREHTFLGQVLARCVKGGVMDDIALWRYITGEVIDEDVLDYSFSDKLHCQPHEFGGHDSVFLVDRMKQSTDLLDLAVATVERWSAIKTQNHLEAPIGYWRGFLKKTSYADIHDQAGYSHRDSERTMLDAVQAGIEHHAVEQTEWWRRNRKRLCFSSEGAFRYFAIKACSSEPGSNLDVIGEMLCEQALLKSELSYELGTLIQAAYFQLDSNIQDAVQAAVLALHGEIKADPRYRECMLREQAQLLVAIPRHLRSPTAQAVIDECEKITWPLVRQPSIRSLGGVVTAPFSFEVFIDCSDTDVIKLLAHYDKYQGNSFDDFLTGGEREVGSQLREAASRHPNRFINTLSERWDDIPDIFRDETMRGIAAYLTYLYGNLQANSAWAPKEEADPDALARKVLDELEMHASHWHHSRAASNAIKGCAHVIARTQDAARLTSLAAAFSTLEEESSISGDTCDLITTGINMARGNAAESLMILANRLKDNEVSWPDSLPDAISVFATDKNPAIRALLLLHMPHFQSHSPHLGWQLFELAMRDHVEGIWTIAERCLYHVYHQRYAIAHPWLDCIYKEGRGKDLQTWGRICALAALSKHLVLPDYLDRLKMLNSAEAWRGAASVWTHPRNVQQHWEQCFAGIEAGFSAENQHASVVAQKFQNLFSETVPLASIPIALVQRCLALLETDSDSVRGDIFGFGAWLNATSALEPMIALEATEIYLAFVRRMKFHLYDHENNLTQLLTRLFAQAEEQEESDGSAMLQRVVAVQDTLLALGISSVNDWLKAAERP